MKTKKEIITTIIIILLSIILIILVGALSLQQTQEQFFMFCADKEWKGIHNITGDFSGEINCSKFWDDYMADGKWTEICSAFSFSSKPSCHTLCNLDCEKFNKENNGMGCIC